MKITDEMRNFTLEKTPYTFVCEECGFVEDLYFKMEEDRPKEYRCIKCGNNSMHRCFGDKSVHIPLDFGSTENKISFDKSPSRRKHFW